MKAANTSKKRDHVLGGEHCFFAAIGGGASKGTGWAIGPLVYMLKEARKGGAEGKFLRASGQ